MLPGWQLAIQYKSAADIDKQPLPTTSSKVAGQVEPRTSANSATVTTYCICTRTSYRELRPLRKLCGRSASITGAVLPFPCCRSDYHGTSAVTPILGRRIWSSCNRCTAYFEANMWETKTVSPTPLKAVQCRKRVYQNTAPPFYASDVHHLLLLKGIAPSKSLLARVGICGHIAK